MGLCRQRRRQDFMVARDKAGGRVNECRDGHDCSTKWKITTNSKCTEIKAFSIANCTVKDNWTNVEIWGNKRKGQL